MINGDVQNTNTACLHSMVYIISVTEKPHSKASAVKLWIISHSETLRGLTDCQHSASGPGRERERKWFAPAAEQRLLLEFQLINDWLIIDSFESEAKNKNY